MGVVTSQVKFSGSPGAAMNYFRDGLGEVSGKAATYYGVERDGILFSQIDGEAAQHLPGLDPSVGLTRHQFEELYEGKWNGEQRLKGGWAKVWKTDAQGRRVMEQVAGTDDWKPIPVMVPVMVNKLEGGRKVLDDKGEPVQIPKEDADGNSVLKQATEHHFTSGYDVVFSANKSVTQYLIAHPDDADLVRGLFLEATTKAMQIAVEKGAKVVRPRDDQGNQVRQTADGLMWAPTYGNTARPTSLSTDRGLIADPHLHIHNFLFAWGWKDGKFMKIDGDDLMKQAEYRGHVADVEFSRLLMENGFAIDFKEPDRKGRVDWELRGADKKLMRFISSNSERRWQLQMELEVDRKHPVTKTEVDRAMQMTKGAKTKAAKKADLGEREYWEHVESVLQKHGMSADMPARREMPVEVTAQRSARLALLYSRLEAPDGLVREGDAVFHEDYLHPAAMRAAIGLGFEAEEVIELADEYAKTHLIEVEREVPAPAAAADVPLRKRPAEPGRWFTTRSVVAAEQGNKKWLDQKAADVGLPVSPFQVRKALGDSKIRLDDGQQQAVWASCSASQLVYVIARAGSGKSTLMETTVKAMRADGLTDKIISVARQNKRGLDTGKMIGADAGGSIEWLELQVANGMMFTASDVVIVDEASLVDSLSLAKLRQAIGPAKTIFIGDPKQQDCIGPGGWFPDELNKRPLVELTKVYRQKNAEHVEILDQLRAGESAKAVIALDRQGRIHVQASPEQSVAKAVQIYEARRSEQIAASSATGFTSGPTTPKYKAEEVGIIFTGSNLELDGYNRAIQRSRIEHQEVSKDHAIDIVEETTGRRWELRMGDLITVKEGIYLGGTDPVRKGTSGKVLMTYPDGRCRLRLDTEDRRDVTVQLSQYADIQPVALRYAVATARAQGDQIRAEIGVIGKPGQTELRTGYTLCSRFTEEFDGLIDAQTWGEQPVVALAQTWAEANEKQLAIHYSELGAEPGVTLEQKDLDLDYEMDFDAHDPSLTVDRIPESMYLRQMDRGLEYGLGL